MAKTLKTMTIFFFFFFFFFSTLVTANIETNIPSFSETLTPETLGLHRNHPKERLSHFHFYVHDSVNGKSPTAVRVAEAATTRKSPTSFGQVSVCDDPMTVLPDRASKQVGRVQGIYVSASHSEFGLMMAMTFAFTEGQYNGSALSILGRNPVPEKLREMPVVGGSGLFRFARGYAQTSTYTFNTTSLDIIVEYNVYVFHY